MLTAKTFHFLQVLSLKVQYVLQISLKKTKSFAKNNTLSHRVAHITRTCCLKRIFNAVYIFADADWTFDFINTRKLFSNNSGYFLFSLNRTIWFLMKWLSMSKIERLYKFLINVIRSRTNLVKALVIEAYLSYLLNIISGVCILWL